MNEIVKRQSVQKFPSREERCVHALLIGHDAEFGWLRRAFDELRQTDIC